MIDLINYDDDFDIIIFNEPIPEYYKIMLVAASDNHNKLSMNYKKNHLDDHLFMCVLTHKKEPVAIFGLYQDSIFPSSVARCFNRYYVIPEWRTKHALINKGLIKTGRNIMFSFYNDYPHYHTTYGIDTLFFTRNVSGSSSEKFLTKKMKTFQFEKLEHPLNYKNTLQWFWVQGDSSFITLLP